jgi:D-alanyl-D-alanine carboxypeptidase
VTTDAEQARSVDPALLAELNIPEGYGADPCLMTYPETTTLEDVGENIVGRMQKLRPVSAAAWHTMQAAAAAVDIELLLVSGFRSIEYQAGLIRRKLNAGQAIADILQVNVAPGYSQHHTGDAVDIATPGYKPLVEEFEDSPAFEWLRNNAAQYGFTLSYPRDNPEGITYEPWHWFRRSD